MNVTAQVLHAMEEFAQRPQSHPAQQKVFYRTTVPGHPHCNVADTMPWSATKVANTYFGAADSIAALPHHWGNISRRNDFIVETIERISPGVVTYIDVFRLSVSRGDRHQSKRDCLHYCLPGGPDTWIDVFALKAHPQWYGTSLLASTASPPALWANG